MSEIIFVVGQAPEDGYTACALGESIFTQHDVTCQTGSCIRLPTAMPSEHHVTVPAHDPLKVGTLAAVPGEVATHLQMDRQELATRLFG
jgi:hypothetical protein